MVSDEARARKLARLMGPARSVPVLVKTLRAVLTTTTRLFGPAAIAPSGGRQPQKLSPLEIPSQPSPGVAISGPEPPGRARRQRVGVLLPALEVVVTRWVAEAPLCAVAA